LTGQDGKLKTKKSRSLSAKVQNLFHFNSSIIVYCEWDFLVLHFPDSF